MITKYAHKLDKPTLEPWGRGTVDYHATKTKISRSSCEAPLTHIKIMLNIPNS